MLTRHGRCRAELPGILHIGVMKSACAFFTWLSIVLLSMATLSAQPRRMWQKSGAIENIVRMAIEPTSGVMAFATGGEERSTFSVRYPDGEVVTRQLACSGPTLQFIDEETLLLFSLELVTEFNISTREITHQQELSLESYLGWFYVGVPNYLLSADASEVLIDAIVGSGKKEHLIVRIDVRTLEELERFTISEWDRDVTFRSPTTDYLFYDYDEVFVEGQQSIQFPKRHRIESIASLHDTCWVMHLDSATKSLWVSRILLDPPSIETQRQIIDNVELWHARSIQIEHGTVVFGFEHDLHALDPHTLETDAVLTNATYLTTASFTADGGAYRTKNGYLITFNNSFEPIDTLTLSDFSIYSLTQDREGRLFGAQGTLVEIDPLTGQTTAFGRATDRVLSDHSSDRFATMSEGAIFILDDPDTDWLQLRLDYGNAPDSNYALFEPLWSPFFVDGKTDVIITSRCLDQDHFMLIERLTPTADTIAPIRTTIGQFENVVGNRCITNADASRFVIYAERSSWPLTIVNGLASKVDGSTAAIYHSFSSSFIMDDSVGVRFFRDNDDTLAPPIDLGERMIPLCAWKNGPYVLGWLDSTSQIAIYNVDTESIIWRNDPSSMPTASHIDEGGKWFVVSYAMGITEGFSLDSMSIDRGNSDTPMFTIGPNPSSVNIELRILNGLQTINGWQIFDGNAHLISTGTGTSINITSLPVGLYHLVVNAGSKSTSASFVVVR